MTLVSSIPAAVSRLIERGVTLPHPGSVWVAEDVDPERIDPSATLCPGTRLSGSGLSIGPDSIIGGETPATVENCQLGAKVELKGGYYAGSVFLDGSGTGSAAHIRPGCLFEEGASAAHAVGCKQTILFPFATLGSLINFCDALLAGGTGPKDHSEVGSSFIHFNFTPHADKATASLLGDVPRGVLLDQPPVFLGGQGGLVGPVTAEYGVVQAAGSVSRSDLNAAGHLYREGGDAEAPRPYSPGRVRDPSGKLHKNLTYLGSLSALRLWYRGFRSVGMNGTPHGRACLHGAETLLAGAMRERRKRLSHWAELVRNGSDVPEAFGDWSRVEDRLDALSAESFDGGRLREIAAEAAGDSHPERVRLLSPEARRTIRDTLQQEINRFAALADPSSMETQS